jgi:hypothetical protein
MISNQYIAGFFDGEGHVRNTGQHSITFAQNDRIILDAIASKFQGGHVYKIRNEYNGCHRLIYNTRKALPILEAMYPHLIGKKLEVRQYMEDYAVYSA